MTEPREIVDEQGLSEGRCMEEGELEWLEPRETVHEDGKVAWLRPNTKV